MKILKKYLAVIFFTGSLMLYGFSIYSNATEIKIATYNTKLLPLPMLLGEHSLKYTTFTPFQRAQTIADQFSDYDIVAFQELMNAADDFALKIKMQQHGFLHFTDRPCESWCEALCEGYLVSGGVRIFSRYPFSETKTAIFPRSHFIEKISAKGVVYAKVTISDAKIINVFALHAQASREENTDQAIEQMVRNKREEQFNELKAFIDEQYIPSNEMILVIGDFNVHRGTANTSMDVSQSQVDYLPEFANLLKILSAKPAAKNYQPSSYLFSLDSETNQIAKDAYGLQIVRSNIDHMLCVTTTNGSIHHTCPDDISRPRMVIDSVRRSDGVDLSDHHAVSLTFDPSASLYGSQEGY